MPDRRLDLWRGPSIEDVGVVRLLNEGAPFDEVLTPLLGAFDVALAFRRA